MLKRLLLGLGKGLLIGGVLSLLLIKGLGVSTFGALLAYPLALLTGVLTGMVAGKPIWRRDARIEVALKSVVGALIAAAAMFGLRKWLTASVDLSAIGTAAGSLGENPVFTLPAIATLLSILFDLDNTGDDGDKAEAEAKAEGSKTRVALDDDSELAELSDETEEEELEARGKR